MWIPKIAFNNRLSICAHGAEGKVCAAHRFGAHHSSFQKIQPFVQIALALVGLALLRVKR